MEAATTTTTETETEKATMTIEILDTSTEGAAAADDDEVSDVSPTPPATLMTSTSTSTTTTSSSTSKTTRRERKPPARFSEMLAYDENEANQDTFAIVVSPDVENAKKRKHHHPLESEEEEEEEEEEDSNTDVAISIPIMGMKIRKKFEDDCYYEGTVIAGPEEVDKEEENGTIHKVHIWRVRYEDDDEEDFEKEELLQWAVMEKAKKQTRATTASGPPTQGNIRTQYDRAKRDLCYKVGVSEEEVTAALDQMEPPYGLNKAMQLIHQAKLLANSHKNNGDIEDMEMEIGGKFVPKVGTRVRKLFAGAAYLGTITGDAEWLDVPPEEAGEDGPQKVLMWEVTFDDGEKEDMDFNELLLCRSSRPQRISPVRGRQLCALELFSGCGMLTQEFAQRLWRVRSIDTEPKSNATDIVDIMKLQFQDINMVPDFIWASPPCFTYSLMAAGKHRSPDKELYEKTPEAHENNRYLAQTAAIIRWAKSINPHLIVVIENPMGLLQKMPLMKELVQSLGLYSTIVNYCCFGRDDKKPTFLWTNDFQLNATLSEFKCPHRCPFKGGIHPIGARQHGYLYNAASIPQPLAEEVAEHVNATFYMRRIRHTPEVTLSQQDQEEFNKKMADKDCN